MIPCMLRTALRAAAAVSCLVSLAARPALACYCVEYCETIQSEVSAPVEGGETPQPNTYVVDVSWQAYPNAPEDCQYELSGREVGSDEWIPLENCETQRNEAGDVIGARCTVTAPDEAGSDAGCVEGVEGACDDDAEETVTTWEYGVSGTSEDRPSADSSSFCTTTITLPGSLDSPANPETEHRQPGLTITWEAPRGRLVESGRSQVQGYRVYRQADGDSASELVGQPTETRYVDGDASASRSYTYEIYAADSYGVGRAAVVRVEGTGSGASGGCASASSAAAPLGLALALGALWRRRRARG
jgi:hypothetical protein